MKSRKLLVFWAVHLTLSIVLILIIILSRESLGGIGITIIITMAGNGATYIGGNVADAWQRSKYYQAELKGDINDQGKA